LKRTFIWFWKDALKFTLSVHSAIGVTVKNYHNLMKEYGGSIVFLLNKIFTLSPPLLPMILNVFLSFLYGQRAGVIACPDIELLFAFKVHVGRLISF